MWNNEQVDWMGRIGRAAFVLLFLAGEGRPLRALEVSQRLKADYETARKYLYDLAELGAVWHTPAGWRPTPAACRLLADGMSWAAAVPPQEPPASVEPAACAEPPGRKKSARRGRRRSAGSFRRG